MRAYSLSVPELFRETLESLDEVDSFRIVQRAWKAQVVTQLRPLLGYAFDIAAASSVVVIVVPDTLVVLQPLSARSSATRPAKRSSPTAIAAVTIVTMFAIHVSAMAVVISTLVAIFITVVIVVAIITITATIRTPTIIVKLRIAAKLSSPAPRHLATTKFQLISVFVPQCPNVGEDTPDSTVGVHAVGFVEPIPQRLGTQVRVAAHDPRDRLPGLTTRFGDNATHGVGEAFGEALGPGGGSSVGIVHFVTGNDDFRHMVFAVPVLDRLCWEEAVQDKKSIGL